MKNFEKIMTLLDKKIALWDVLIELQEKNYKLYEKVSPVINKHIKKYNEEQKELEKCQQ